MKQALEIIPPSHMCIYNLPVWASILGKIFGKVLQLEIVGYMCLQIVKSRVPSSRCGSVLHQAFHTAFSPFFFFEGECTVFLLLVVEDFVFGLIFFFFPLQFKPVHTQNKPSYLLPFFPWLELHSYSIWVKFLILTVLTLESPSPTFAPKRMFLCMVFFHPCRPTLLFCSCFLPLISVPTVWFLSKVRSYSIWIVSLNHKSVHVHH